MSAPEHDGVDFVVDQRPDEGGQQPLNLDAVDIVLDRGGKARAGAGNDCYVPGVAINKGSEQLPLKGCFGCQNRDQSRG